MRRVCVYCGSSAAVDSVYLDAAYRLGVLLAEAGITVLYGGGGLGSMGRLADGALNAGGQVICILPRFMEEIEWGHTRLTDLRLVEDMHTRKRLLLEGADAIVVLPGGVGTFDKLFEALTLKRLGLYSGAIILVNTRGFFAPCLRLLELCTEEGFLSSQHLPLWQVVETPEQVLEAVAAAPKLSGGSALLKSEAAEAKRQQSAD